MHFKSFYFIIAFIQIKLILNEKIRVFATNKVSTKCENGLYFIEIKVSFSSSSNKYYSFPLELISPIELELKCSFDFQNESIFCFSNLDSNKFELEIGEFIIFPTSFPNLEDIEFDYDSFVKNIYAKEWIMENDCLSKDYNSKDNWSLVGNITEINEEKCSYSTNTGENKFNFKLKANIQGENLKNKILKNENLNSLNGNFEIEILEEIWMPILINVVKGQYRKFDDFSFAFCSINHKLLINNLINKEIILDCNIPIIEGKILVGIIMIKPFYDYIHIRINSNDIVNNKIIFENIFFNINRTFEEEIESNSYENKLNTKFRRNEETDKENININSESINNSSIIIIDRNEISEVTETEKNTIIETETINNDINTIHLSERIENENNDKNKTEKNNTNNNNNEIEKNNLNTTKKTILKNIDYFIIGDKKKVYCPDKPIFTIKDSDTDILLFSSNEKDYIFMLKGKLVNGLQEIENAYNSITEILEDIFFSIQVVDNLAEDEDNPRAQANCSIKVGTPFYQPITIFCHANKISEESMKSNNTDIILNWGIERNRLFDDIIIKWPNDKRKRKHMYSYNIQGFSLAQSNYGCVNNEFYFYIYIFDLEYEADISFEIQMKNPSEPKAKCKLYDSSIIKCYFPLYQQKLEKHTHIDLPTNSEYHSIDEQGNKVIFQVEEYDYDYEDFHLTVKETCGEHFIVGALKRAGFNYFKVLMIILAVASFTFILFILFLCFVIYKITHRNRKGLYIRHIEEDINNNLDDVNNDHSKSEKKVEIISSKT